MLYQICYETYATMLNYNVAVGSLTLFNSSFSMSYIEILTGEILFNSSFSMSCINIGLRNDRLFCIHNTPCRKLARYIFMTSPIFIFLQIVEFARPSRVYVSLTVTDITIVHSSDHTKGQHHHQQPPDDGRPGGRLRAPHLQSLLCQPAEHRVGRHDEIGGAL